MEDRLLSKSQLKAILKGDDEVFPIDNVEQMPNGQVEVEWSDWVFYEDTRYGRRVGWLADQWKKLGGQWAPEADYSVEIHGRRIRVIEWKPTVMDASGVQTG